MVINQLEVVELEVIELLVMALHLYKEVHKRENGELILSQLEAAVPVQLDLDVEEQADKIQFLKQLLQAAVVAVEEMVQ